MAEGRLLLPTPVVQTVSVDAATARDARAWLSVFLEHQKGLVRHPDTLWLLAPPPTAPVNKDDGTFRLPPAQLLSSPVGYLPGAVAIKVARLFEGGFAAQVLIVRLAALATGVALGALALRLMPFGAWIAFFVLLLPSAVWLRSGHPV